MRYPHHTAGLGNIATLIREMGRGLGVRALTKVCRRTGETPILQRLGWMLNKFSSSKMAEVVLQELKHGRLETVPLEMAG